eukprot:14094129-Ditylum_brightwellii.AAC.1
MGGAEKGLYMRTFKEIAQYAGQICCMTEDIEKAIKKPEETIFKAPMLHAVKEKNRHMETNKMEDSTTAFYLNNEID